MKWVFSVLIAILIGGGLQAQQRPVTVVGPITPGDCAKFQSVTVLVDAGVCGPGSSPGGSNGNIQYNNAGAFAGLTDAQVATRMLTGTTAGNVVVNTAGAFDTLTNTQLTAKINAATVALPGALPAWPGNTTTFFRGDGGYATLNFAAVGGTLGCSQLAALTGDVTNALCVTTLATVNPSPGTWGSGTFIPSLTVDNKGRITGASQTALTYDANNLTGSTLASRVTASSLTSVGVLGGGSADTGFTIVANDVTWSGFIPAANLPLATVGAFGAVKPDGSSILISAGTISAPGSGGGTVGNCPLDSIAYYAAAGTTTACILAVSSSILTMSPSHPAMTTSLPTGFGINASNITWTGTIPGTAMQAVNVAAGGNGGITGVQPVANGGTGVTNLPITPQHRLTLVSGTAVMVTSQTAATTLYSTPANGALIPLYDGSTAFTPAVVPETSIVLGSNWATNSVFDVFIGSDSGTVRLCTGPAWSSNTGASRAAAGAVGLTNTNGIQLNTGSLTCRYNNTTTFTCAALRCTYMGTVHTAAAGAINYIFGGLGSGGLAADFGVWNYWNRSPVVTFVGDTSATYTYAVATTWRQAHGSTTYQINAVRGFDSDLIDVLSLMRGATGSGNAMSAGIGVNSTTTPSQFPTAWGTGTIAGNMNSSYSGLMGLGYVYVAPLEWNIDTNASTWVTILATPPIQTGIKATLWQ